MLMDMFYGATEGVIKHRRRFHFHEVNHLQLLYVWFGKLTEQSVCVALQ
jgi:predicted ATPase